MSVRGRWTLDAHEPPYDWPKNGCQPQHLRGAATDARRTYVVGEDTHVSGEPRDVDLVHNGIGVICLQSSHSQPQSTIHKPKPSTESGARER
jgi:hypothetical protein